MNNRGGKGKVSFQAAFKFVGRDLEWHGKGVDEVGVEKETGKVRVKVNPAFYRPIEATQVLGDPTKLTSKTGWKFKITFDQLVEDMVKADLERVKTQLEE